MADFYAEALAAARAGDEKTAREKLAARAEKMSSPTYKGNGGGTSMEAATAEVNRILGETSGASTPAPAPLPGTTEAPKLTTLPNTGGTPAPTPLANTGGAAASSPYAGTNYHQDAIDAAKRGDWDAVKKYLALREEKIAAEGGDNRGKTSLEIYWELWDQYGASDAEKLTGDLMGIYGEDGPYAKALADQQAANDAAVEKAVSSLESQKTDTNQSYADLFKQMYINKMNSKKNIAQQMAAQGVTGGAAESTLLGLNTSYEEALRQGEQERIGTLGDLDKAITDTRLTGDITNAEAAAANAKERGAGYASVLQSLLNQENLKSSTNQSNARQTALAILQTGNMASEELLEAAGISTADAAAIVEAVNSSKKETAAATDRDYALDIVLFMLENGDMPSEALLNASGISYADAVTMQQRALSNKQNTQNEQAPVREPEKGNDLFGAIAALSGMSEDQVEALWNSGYRFNDFATYLPALDEVIESESGVDPERQAVIAQVKKDLNEAAESGGYTGAMLAELMNRYIQRGVITDVEAGQIATDLGWDRVWK